MKFFCPRISKQDMNWKESRRSGQPRSYLILFRGRRNPMRKIFEVIVLVALLQSGIAGCGTVGGILVFDPINYVGSSSGPNVDWNRAPLSVVKRSAYLDRRLQEAQRDYDAAKNAMRDEARAAARRDFEHGFPRGAHAPPILCGEAREAYGQEFDSLERDYRSKLEQRARQLGELEFYRS